jgi:hypothetical protein
MSEHTWNFIWQGLLYGCCIIGLIFIISVLKHCGESTRYYIHSQTGKSYVVYEELKYALDHRVYYAATLGEAFKVKQQLDAYRRKQLILTNGDHHGRNKKL